MIMSRVLLLLALLLALSAPAAAQETPPPPPASDDSPFQRRDAPPDEVAAQLNFGGAVRGDAGLDCIVTPLAAPTGSPLCTLEVADEGTLEFRDFAPNEPIVVQVTRPDGSTAQDQIVANDRGIAESAWLTLPGEPLGAHAVLATQGGLEASGTFMVRAASEPQTLVLPRSAPPGTTFQVALAGFAPGQTVPLRLYRELAETYWYLTDLPAPQTNAQGEAIITLTTATSDAEGRYLVVTEPRVAAASQLNGQFLLTHGGDPTLRDPQAQTAALVQFTLEEAARVWASVAASPGRRVSDLERVFAGPRLAEVQAEIEAMRASGQTRTARLTAPVTVQSAQELSRFRIDATVTEMWEDRLLNADGSLASDLSGRRDRRYALELRFEPCYCWFVIESQVLR